MAHISEILGKFKKEREVEETKKRPPHEHAATVDLIQAMGLVKGKYNYKYWLGKVHSAGVDYNEMIGILKEIRNMDPKYNKGGRLTNVLTTRAKARKTKK
jgi:hypothetical protein